MAMDLEELKNLISGAELRPWNPIIASVFYRAGIIEKWGPGTLNIIDWCKGNSNPKPSWIEQSGSLVLKLFPNASATLATQKESQLELPLESQQKSLHDRVLPLLASGPFSKSEITARLGQKQPSGPLHTLIRLLMDEGAIACTIPEKPNSRLQKYKLVRHPRVGRD